MPHVVKENPLSGDSRWAAVDLCLTELFAPFPMITVCLGVCWIHLVLLTCQKTEITMYVQR